MGHLKTKAKDAGFDPAMLSDPETRKAYSNTALKAFARMMDQWDVPVEQRCAILGDVPKTTYHKWVRDGASLSRDQLERIGLTLGTYKGLKLLFADEAGQLRWLKSPNEDYAFKGRAPIERMAEGGMLDLYAVREYVDAMRGAR